MRLHEPQNRGLGRAGREVEGVYASRMKEEHLSKQPFLGLTDELYCHCRGQASSSFAFVHDSVVFDNARKLVYVQPLLPYDWLRIRNTIAMLESPAVQVGMQCNLAPWTCWHVLASSFIPVVQ